MEKSVVTILNKISIEVFHAETELNEKASRLVVSVPIEGNDWIHLIFYEKIRKFPVLVLNMPPMPWRNNTYCRFLMNFLEWYFGGLPEPIESVSEEFLGHTFHGWQPNCFNPIQVYSWSKKVLSKTEINDFVLGLK